MRCNIYRWMLAAVLTILLTVGGAGALEPVTGDLNGDGTDSYGTFDPSTAGFTFNGKTVHFGTSTDLPVMGDWDHDGKDEIGVFRPDEGGQSKFYLITRDWATFSDGANAGAADKTIPFGYYPNNIPIAGDWDGDGDDDMGGFNPGNNNFYLYILNLPSSSATSYAPHPSVSFGTAGDTPMIGDWDGDGDDDVGIFRSLDPNPSTNSFYLDLSLTGGQHELGPYLYGNVGDKPVAGDWDGDGDDNIGVYRPSTEQFYTDSNIPLYPMPLYVTVSESPDPVTSGGTSQVTVRVTTTGDIPVSGASVSVSATGGSLSPTSGTTDANGNFKPIYTAPTVTTTQTYTISATTSKTGYTSGSGSDMITVHQSSTTVITVDDDGPADYNSIQAAVYAASAGDTIEVRSGMYHENVDVNKRLTLRGEGADVVTVWAANPEDHVFYVSRAGVSISGFTLTGATGYQKAGIRCNGGCVIFDNNVSNNYGGIWNWGSSSTTLIKNTVNSNVKYGIWAIGSNTTLIDNIVNSNGDGPNCAGIQLSGSNYTLINNTANLNNHIGIWLVQNSRNSTFINNTVSNSNWGILIQASFNNTLTGNTVSNSGGYGMYLQSFSDTLVYHNRLYHNNLASNGINAWDTANSNFWDSGSEGNYHGDDYTGADSDGDGIGDTPYLIPGGSSVDRYPLMAPYSPITYSVGEDADLAIKNHFIDAYNRSGGVNVLGNPTTKVHEAWGYLVQDFPGVSGIPGGVIMYNDIKGAAYYIHGAIWERYYTFVNKSELGPVASDEGEAAILPQGTTGRYTKFETGTIHWISDKDGENMGHSQRGESFVTYGELDALYTSMGGTYSDLGFPVMDQEDRDGHGYCDFEGGYIEWDDVSGEYKALPYELSVKITSPNSDEIFKKGAIITFKGEIHGGTPEFGYLWIIDGNVQKEISNERNSEIQKEDLLIGEHEVKLQVYDSRGNVAESDKIEFKVVTWKIAIIPIKFLDISSNLAIDDLKERADYVVDYYYEQSYHQEYLGYKIISSKTESDRWHLINENYDPLIMECEKPDQNILNCGMRYYEEALKLTECNLEQENIPSKIIGYDASMVVYPNNIRSKSYGSPGCYVKGNASYGIWAHELGHTLFNFQDMAGDEKIGGDIDNWGLMGYGCKMNPPTPIIGYNKNRSGWLSYNDISYSEIIGSSKECPIYYLDDLNIRNEGLLRFETNPKSKVDYYIFEGRHERDNVPIDRLLDINYPLFSTGAIEGVMIYQVEDGNISISRSLLDELFSFGVTLLPDTSKFIAPDIKVTAFRDDNQLKLKIEEIIPKWIRIWEIKASIPSGGGGGRAGVPIENNLDIDLHVVSFDGKKVGMNYSTGRYYVQIEGVNTSGNVPSGGYEWISVPMNIGAEAYVDLTPELKELLRNNDSINVEVISTFITYDESGNRKESDPITIDINSENVDSPLIVSLPINTAFLPPITTMDQFNLTDGRTIPIKFTARNSSTNEFIYDDTVNATITNSTGHLIAIFTNGTGTDSVRINSTEEQYIVNFHTKNYDLNVGETYTIHITFGEADALRGYAITHFTLV